MRMTTATTHPISADLVRTARITGLFYLGLAITGLVGSLLIRSQLYDSGDSQATLANLTDHEWLARTGIALEMGVVITQALAAVWFYRLFRGVDSFAAGSLAAFGLVNAVAILGAAAMLATALEVSGDASLAAPGGLAATVQLSYVIAENLWGVAATFFGLWLIPMGWLVLRSQWLPRPLGWLLICGGAAYVVSAFVKYLVPDSGSISDLLTLPATVGELWIVAYLIIFGVRAHAPAPTSADTQRPAASGSLEALRH
jgi:Domain of unknown function (DUF4386)